MKNVLSKGLLLLMSGFLFSCSQNDDASSNTAENTPFFNLNVGSKWVYKKYENSPDNPNQFAFSGIVDTVKIVGIETIQGLKFAKKSSKKVNINNGTVEAVTYSYVRINSLGHLIEITDKTPIENLTETDGQVIHPIKDFNYVYDREVNDGNGHVFGTIEFKLYSAENIVVEGQNYNVLPYNGIFTPSLDHPELISKTVQYNYAPTIGLVRYVCHSVAGNYTWEERLVSYEIK